MNLKRDVTIPGWNGHRAVKKPRYRQRLLCPDWQQGGCQKGGRVKTVTGDFIKKARCCSMIIGTSVSLGPVITEFRRKAPAGLWSVASYFLLVAACIRLWTLAAPTAFAQNGDNSKDATEPRIALVIGDADYRGAAKPTTAVADAEALKKELAEHGFQVVYRVNADRQTMLEAIDEFVSKLSPGAVSLVYFSGIGTNSDGVNYLIPIDKTIQGDSDISHAGIDFGKLLDRIVLAQTKFSLAIIDACHDGLSQGAEHSLGAKKKCLLPPTSNPKGIMVVYAAGSNQEALDHLGANDFDPNGLFMREFLKSMQKPGLKAQDVVRDAKQAVIDHTKTAGLQQSPEIYDHSLGTFFFSGPSTSLQRPPPLPQASAPSGDGSQPPGWGFRDCPDCPEMVVVPPGGFVMGSKTAEATKEGIPDLLVTWERPPHPVMISRSFALGKYPVTRGEFAAFARDTGYSPNGCYLNKNNKLSFDQAGNWHNPGFAQNDDHPVVCVSYEDAQRYVTWLNEKVRRISPASYREPGPYRLPSEAEWEYAARGGTTAARWWGDDIGSGRANCYGCGGQWDGKQTSPTGSFKPNPFGLFDMLGNVFQWTEDCGQWSYIGAPSDGAAWTVGDCGNHIARGGSWFAAPRYVRSAGRQQFSADRRLSDTGFRLTKTLP
jgi:formylglycine-generating enzyme required for sulfatase activity